MVITRISRRTSLTLFYGAGERSSLLKRGTRTRKPGRTLVEGRSSIYGRHAPSFCDSLIDVATKADCEFKEGWRRRTEKKKSIDRNLGRETVFCKPGARRDPREKQRRKKSPNRGISLLYPCRLTQIGRLSSQTAREMGRNTHASEFIYRDAIRCMDPQSFFHVCMSASGCRLHPAHSNLVLRVLSVLGPVITSSERSVENVHNIYSFMCCKE